MHQNGFRPHGGLLFPLKSVKRPEMVELSQELSQNFGRIDSSNLFVKLLYYITVSEKGENRMVRLAMANCMRVDMMCLMPCCCRTRKGHAFSAA